MFVVVYRWRLKPGHEAQFARDWRDVTLLAREKYGSGGSSLFKAHDDSYRRHRPLARPRDAASASSSAGTVRHRRSASG